MQKIKLDDFITDIEDNCSQLAGLCIVHILEKDFDLNNKESIVISLENRDEILMDYIKFSRYLNDYAGVIYNKFESSIDNIYNELCRYYDLETDNKYLYSYRLNKLKKNDPSRIMTIEDDDMKLLALQRIEEKLEQIFESKYYKENKDDLKSDIEPIEKNIELLKKVLKHTN